MYKIFNFSYIVFGITQIQRFHAVHDFELVHLLIQYLLLYGGNTNLGLILLCALLYKGFLILYCDISINTYNKEILLILF